VSRDRTVRVAVVGHVEWIEFARVERVPTPGEIVHALDSWEEPGGGGAVAAVQLARLAGDCLFLTALGDDETGHRAKRELEAFGVRVEATWHPEPQRRAFVFTDAAAERTITVMGERLGPRGDDPLPWSELGGIDGVYFTAGDAGAVRAARVARTLVSTARAIRPLAEAGVQIDMLVSSSRDFGERYTTGAIDPPPLLVARTAGSSGGWVETPDGTTTEWTAAPLPGPPVDAYGAGDSFAAGLTYGLATGRSPEEALALGARCGAACVTGRGPYAGQLRSAG
jgi:ribokinase